LRPSKSSRSFKRPTLSRGPIYLASKHCSGKEKNPEKWWMFIDYIDLKKACPKDIYPLPGIDRLA